MGGNLQTAACIHSSSGSTGQPQYWPCSLDELQRAKHFYASILEGQFLARQRSTLMIVCFGMGTWIAGSYTSACGLLLQLDAFPLTIVTPGFNRAEALRILGSIGCQYDQVVLAGIPSFIKDLAEAWRRSRDICSRDQYQPILHFLLAGEPFPESWRSYILGLTQNSSSRIVSMLGSADAGFIGFETDVTIRLRQKLARRTDLRKEMLGDERVPSIFCYDPCYRYLETREDQLLVTAERAVPLIRYNTLDYGRIVETSYKEPVNVTRDHRSHGPFREGIYPLVYLFGRGARSTTLFGANIYAESVQDFLFSSPIKDQCTGRFVMRTEYDNRAEQKFLLHFELTDGVNPNDIDQQKIARELAQVLRTRSSEYSRIWDEYGERALPYVLFHPYESPEHFSATTQRKYT